MRISDETTRAKYEFAPFDCHFTTRFKWTWYV